MLIAVYGAVCVLHLFCCAPPEKRLPRMISKCFLMPLLALCYCFNARFGGGAFSPLVLAALLCGFAGDALLLFPDNSRLFAAGLLAFAAGHICYAVYMLGVPKPVPLDLWFYIPAALAYLAVAFLIMRLLRPALPQGFFFPCLGYMLIIGFMSLSALYLHRETKTVSSLLVFIGSLLFIASDTLLSFREFHVKQSRFSNFWVMLTYILAQTLIVSGLALV